MKLNTVDLNKFHVFRVVAESDSMRKAGEQLLRTPSAISQSITSLERSLGIRLFARTGVRLELTEAGRKILHAVKSTERNLESALEEFRNQPTRLRGTVNLGMPPGYPAVSLSKALSAALLDQPELQLRLRFLTHAELAESLRAGHLEVALSLQPLRLWNRRIRSSPLREENLILAIPSRYRHLCTGPIKELPVVDYYQRPLMVEGWLKHHRQRKVKTNIRVFGANLEHVLQMVLEGVGCAVVPRHAIEPQLLAGNLLEHNWDKRRPWIVRVWLNTFHSVEKLSPCTQKIWTALES